MLVSRFRTRTATPGSMPPDVSWTVPMILAAAHLSPGRVLSKSAAAVIMISRRFILPASILPRKNLQIGATALTGGYLTITELTSDSAHAPSRTSVLWQLLARCAPTNKQVGRSAPSSGS